MLKAMYDNGVNITTQEDANMYDTFAFSSDYIIAGVGDQLAITTSSLTATLGTGSCVMQGRHITETDGTTAVQIPANTNGYLVIRYDIANVAGNEGSLEVVTTITRQDLKNNGTIREIPLYQFVATGSSITLTDIREYNVAIGDDLNARAFKGRIVNVSIPLSYWAATSGKYSFTQTVSVAGVTAQDYPIAGSNNVILSTKELLEAHLVEFAKIKNVEAVDGGIKFDCLTELPTVNLYAIVLLGDYGG